MHDYKMIYDHSSEYPKHLSEIRKHPQILYARGNLALLNTPCFAIVGTRNNTLYGKINAEYFTKGLVSYGFTIVSGLAFGVDAVVHDTTLKNGGKTIAVLGSGIDIISPASNEWLANEILNDGGLIISEYSPGTPANKHHFPARNRIISGLSVGSLIIEAPEKSGALITARRAFEQNRDVFAIPGDLSRETTTGNHHLIANEMARLVRTPEDIISNLSHQPELILKPMIKKTLEPKLATRAQRRVWKVLSQQPIMADEILKKTKLSISEVNVVLSYLELKGHIKDVGIQRYIRAI